MPVLVTGQSASDQEAVALHSHTINVREVADLPANLGLQIRLNIVGPASIKEGVTGLGIRHNELETVGDLAYTRRLLGRSEGEHRFKDRGHSS